MPIPAAADMMVRRGQSKSYGQACAHLRALRRRDYGRTVITSADRDARARVESPSNYRAPYADHE